MPLPTAQFPDIELLLVTWLGDQGPVTGRLCTDLPATITGTVIRVLRISGANRSLRVDRPIVDIDIFSDDYADAIANGLLIQNLLLFSLRDTQTPQGYVQNVTTVIGPRWMPETNQDLVRYGASYELHTHP
jgi:hypothetical protein